MGIVLRQSAANTINTYFGFAIGAVNLLLLYTTFLGKQHFGIVSFVLSAASILMPLFAFGVHSTMIRFYSSYTSEIQKQRFLSFMLMLPLFIIIPVSIGLFSFYDQITFYVLKENPMLKPFLWLIPIVGIFMAYFEIFYAWVKIHMKSVLGNFISEVFVRIIVMALLFAVHFEWIEKDTFVYCLSAAYGLQFLAMKVYAIYIKTPKLTFQFPDNSKDIVRYSVFIIISGSVGLLLLEFDKVMIPAYEKITSNAVYSIAIFIATVIAVPSRAMLQIIYPITAKLMSENKMAEVDDLYKKSSITLQVLGGLILLCILLNIDQMFLIIPGDYAAGTMTVFFIGIAKFYDVALGNNNAIILNTKYYKWVLSFGILLVVMMVGLNMWLIPIYGITGSALATLISAFFYNTIKLLFIVKKMHLYPFTLNNLKSLGIISAIFLAFYFWNFPFHPIINILLKSGVIGIIYVIVNYKLKISEEINQMIDSVLQRFVKRS